jgi:tetratricopeptide (TPR) repeat protein
MGRSDEAIAEMNEALELEPLNLLTGALLAQTYMYAGKNEQALEQARKTYDLDKTFVLGRYALGRAYNANGMYREAITISQETLQADPKSQFALLVLGNAYARSDQRSAAENVIQKFKELSKTEYVAPYYVATVYAVLGDKEQAFAEFKKAYYEHDWLLPRLKVDPLMDSLREDPRYKDLVRRINLPE